MLILRLHIIDIRILICIGRFHLEFMSVGVGTYDIEYLLSHVEKGSLSNVKYNNIKINSNYR